MRALSTDSNSTRRGRCVRAAAAALTVATATAAIGAFGATPSGGAATDPAGVKQYISTQGGDASEQIYTEAEAAALARRFDLIIGLKTTFRATGLTPVLRAANPDLDLFVYTNGTHTAPSEATGLAESMFAHDAQGRRVINVTFGNHVMNPRSAGWRSYVAAECVDFMNRMGANGCYLDDMGVGNLTTNFSAVPIDPNTAAPYTDAGWMDATSSLAGAVKTALPGKLVFANGLNSGARYFGSAQSSRMLAAVDGSDAEGFVRGQSQALTTFRKEATWKQDVDMLVDAGARGKSVLATTKVWVSASNATINQLHRYSLATFMLGTDGTSYFNFNARGPGGPDIVRPLDGVDLGHPTGTYAKVGGVYQRTWSKGTVYVNPTTVPVTVALGGSFTNLDGAMVTSITLAPYTADIVRPTTVTPPPSTAKCNGVPVTIAGTAGADTITGTPGRDVINGLGGADSITGLGGDDLICGNTGADTIDAGDGNDLVIGGSQNDVIFGGNGDDDLRGWSEQDWIDGGAGIDDVNGGGATDVCVQRVGDTLTSCDSAVAG